MKNSRWLTALVLVLVVGGVAVFAQSNGSFFSGALGGKGPVEGGGFNLYTDKVEVAAAGDYFDFTVYHSTNLLPSSVYEWQVFLKDKPFTELAPKVLKGDVAKSSFHVLKSKLCNAAEQNLGSNTSIKIVLDPQNRIQELDENDNTYGWVFGCKHPGNGFSYFTPEPTPPVVPVTSEVPAGQKLTRCDLALQLVVGFKLTSSSVGTFPDITDATCKKNAGILSGLGIMTGYPNGTFGPKDGVIRSQVAKAVTLASGKELIEFGLGGPGTYSDVNPGDWFYQAVTNLAHYSYTAAGNKEVAGFPDGTFKPGDVATKSWTHTMISLLAK